MQVTDSRRQTSRLQPSRRTALADRRAQIVAATIETIAELSYARASFAAIAARGGLSSTRLISYHFQSRDELMRVVASQIVGDLGAAVAAAMARARSPREAVHTYLRANVAYVDSHRAEMLTLTRLLFAGALSPESADDGTDGETTEWAVAGLIRAGIEAGEFGPVDPVVAARVLQRTVESISLSLHRNPRVDLSRMGDDLVAFFDTGLGTRAPSTPPSRGGS